MPASKENGVASNLIQSLPDMEDRHGWCFTHASIDATWKSVTQQISIAFVCFFFQPWQMLSEQVWAPVAWIKW